MYCCPNSLFCYCPIIRIDICVISSKMTFFINFISFHIFAIYVGGACWGLPAACRLIAVSGARLPSVDGLTVRYIKNAPLLNLPSKYVCDLFQTCFQYMYVRYKHTGTMLLCLQVALSFI